MSFAKMVKSVNDSKKNLKILVMGLDNAGKTTLLSKYLNIQTLVAPTFGYKVYTKKSSEFDLTIMDIGGQSSFRRFWTNYFESTDGIVFIVDCSDQRMFTEYLEEVLKLEIPVSVLFNKIDQNPGFDLDQANEAFKPFRDVKCFKSSALKNLGVEEGFEWLIRRILA